MKRKTLFGVAAALLSFCAIIESYALGPQEQQSLAAVEQYLKQIEGNLKLAREAAGPGDGVPAAAKAKLAKVRLDQGAGYVPLVGDELKKLPKSDSTVQLLADRYEAATLAVQALNDRLSGKVVQVAATEIQVISASSAGPTAVATVPGSKKLDYRQEELLKGAQFNLREVEGNAGALVELVDKLKPVADQNTIDHRLLVAAMNTVANAERKAGFTEDALKKLPEDGTGVAESWQSLSKAKESVASSVVFLKPLHEKLMQLIAPATYPEITEDVKRMRDLSAMYGNTALLQNNRTEAAALLRGKQAASEEAKRLLAKYGPLIMQKTDLGNQVEGARNGFMSSYNAFIAAAEQLKATLPSEVRAELASANKLADEAVQQQNGRYFAGGIVQNMALAEDKLLLLRALDDGKSQFLADEIAQVRDTLAKRQKSLEALIIKETQVPPDRYVGGDKSRLVEVAVSSWKKQQSDAVLLGSAIPGEQWTRTTRWEYANGTWTFIDFSKLQVQLLVKKDSELAVIRPVDLKKDHLKGDQVIGIPLDSLADNLIPQRYVQLSKIK